MTLEPGGLRELHWHANAAEWAYVIEGRCRVTTIDPENRCEIVDFSPGDVWYFPRGHGHLIQGLGPGTCTFVLVFDNGYFSEFGTFSITDWIGHTPPEVLAKTFNLPAETFADFPKKEVYIATGPVPPPLPQESAQGSLDAPPLTHRYQLLAQKQMRLPAARCARCQRWSFRSRPPSPGHCSSSSQAHCASCIGTRPSALDQFRRAGERIRQVPQARADHAEIARASLASLRVSSPAPIAGGRIAA